MKRCAYVVCLAFAPLLSARADEGMWMPQQLPALADRLKALGFQGDANAFADLTGFPMGAVVSLGGCSASFVSPDGLIVTNHHCVQSALQFNSTPQRNLMKNGFLARTHQEELWAGPGSRVYVTVAVTDVTRDVMDSIGPGLSDRERFDVVERRVKAQTAACEKEGLRCTIAPFFDGVKWYQISQLEIQDVRLVYAPAAGIGNFGGETDNWQWPRHTGDFSFYRAYVAKDGKSAPHAEGNVPYKPKHHLKVSPKGASPGELVFVAGYPGRTFRLNTFGQVRENVAWRLPRAIQRSTDRIAILEKLARSDSETAIRVSTTIRGLNNGLTKNKGVLQGLAKGGLLAQKEAAEKALVAWIDGDSERRSRYGDVLPALNALLADGEKTRERDALLTELSGGVGSALGAAQTIYRFAVEEPKPDTDRDPAFQKRNWTRIRDGLDRMQRSLDPKADRAMMRYTLAHVAQLAGDQRVEALDRAIGLKQGMAEPEALRLIDRFLDQLIADTQLYHKDFRLGLLGKSGAELADTKDSMLALAAALYPLEEAIRNKGKEQSGAYYRLGPRYAAALLAKNGGLVAPDANSTLRVTFGTVKGVEPRDGIFYLPQTTLAGILQKATGKGEFDAPRAELKAIEAMRAGKSTPYLDSTLNDVPVDFLSTVDTTGGNSGSATLNGRGELVGLLFDGTFDTVASDYVFDRKKTRSIHVDTRDMLWVMTEVDHADNLLHELGFPGRE
jgi:hypothetical protein